MRYSSNTVKSSYQFMHMVMASNGSFTVRVMGTFSKFYDCIHRTINDSEVIVENEVNVVPRYLSKPIFPSINIILRKSVWL